MKLPNENASLDVSMSSYTSGYRSEEQMNSSKKWNLSSSSSFLILERTSYLNSTLKAILHVPSFSNWLQSNRNHQQNCNKHSCIICSMAHVLNHTKGNTSPIWPVDIYDKLCSSFTVDSEHDYNEFLHHLIDSIHEASTSSERITINKLFYGMLRSSTKCYSCHHETIENFPFQQLTLNITEIDDIEEALKNYFAPMDVSHNCQWCNENVPATKKLSIQQYPVTLCIQLKRSEDANNAFIGKHLKPSREIDLIKYSYDYASSNKLYRLVSMITDNLNATDCDHYVAIGITQDESYFPFDDESIQDISSNFSFYEHPCIVFYELLAREHDLLIENNHTIQQPLPKKMKYDDDHLSNLNKECLYEIFKHFALHDLCSIAETCTTLKEAAKEIFSRRYKTLRFDQNSIRKMVWARKIVSRMLTNFGALVSEFLIYFIPSGILSMSIMNTIIRYCSGNVESIRLIRCNRAHIRPILKNIFPNLKNFAWETDDKASYFDDFLSRHNNLQTLTIQCSDDYISLLSIISSNCKNLVELDIKATGQPKQVQSNDFESFVSLQKLTRLRMHFPGKNVTKIVEKLKQMKKLTTLEIVGAQADHYFIPTLSYLKQIYVLRMVDCSNLEYLNPLCELVQLKALSIQVKKNETAEVYLNVVKLIKSLINLETLFIRVDTFKMDRKTYLEIVDIVKGRRENSIEIECQLLTMKFIIRS